MRIRTLAVGLLVGGLALTACGKEGSPNDPGQQVPQQQVDQNVTVQGSPTFDRIKSKGRVTIGVKDDQPGLGYKDPTTNKYSGFDIEIAKLMAAKLGYGEDKIDYKAVPSAGREQAIINGDVDYYVGSYTISDKRKQQVGFAGPYYNAGQSILVKKDNNTITGKDTLKGQKVCSVSGSTPIQRVRDDGLTEPGNIVELQNYSQCIAQIDAGQVQALTTDDAILKGYAAKEPDKFKVVGEPFSDEPYGIGLAKDDKALRDKMNNVLTTAINDGTWQQIYDNTLGKSGSPAKKPTVQPY